jgi:hypothetical protein
MVNRLGNVAAAPSADNGDLLKKGAGKMIGLSAGLSLYFVLALPVAVMMHLVGHYVLQQRHSRGVAATAGLLALLYAAFAVPAEIGLAWHQEHQAEQEAREIASAMAELAARLHAQRAADPD